MKTTTYGGQILNLILNNVDISGLARGAETAGNIYIALHTADPGAAGNQETNEVSYTGYGREAIARTGAAWTVSNDTATNAAPVEFGQRTNAGTVSAAWFSVGTAETGTGSVLYRGELNSALAISENVTPRFGAGDISIKEE